MRVITNVGTIKILLLLIIYTLQSILLDSIMKFIDLGVLYQMVFNNALILNITLFYLFN